MNLEMARSPLWLDDPGVQHLLNALVDRDDAAIARGKESLTNAISLTEVNYPALFKADFESDRERYWMYLEFMQEWHWFEIRLAKNTRGGAPYERLPKLAIRDMNAIRQVVKRPARVGSYGEAWRKAVWEFLVGGDTIKEQVSQYRIEIAGRTPGEIVERLNRLHEFVDTTLMLRDVSSKLFWGQSKLLDSRENLVAAVLGVDECPIPKMPIAMHVFLPKNGFDGILFVENWTTFDRSQREQEPRYERLALVFGSGFKGSASRLRTPTGASIFYSQWGDCEPAARQRFESWLYAKEDQPCWFWGDLDFAGMGILAALRRSFSAMEAWKPGYALMLSDLNSGAGHLPEAADKSGQRDIGMTGCRYADTVLMPSIREAGMFVDQEGY